MKSIHCEKKSMRYYSSIMDGITATHALRGQRFGSAEGWRCLVHCKLSACCGAAGKWGLGSDLFRVPKIMMFSVLWVEDILLFCLTPPRYSGQPSNQGTTDALTTLTIGSLPSTLLQRTLSRSSYCLDLNSATTGKWYGRSSLEEQKPIFLHPSRFIA